jgi:hypothetical protein
MRRKALKKRTHHICVVVFYTMLASVTTLSAQANDVLTCPDGTEPFTEYRLFFGRSQGGVEVVSDAAWQAFLADEITPRFPDGLTVLDAAGQWRDGSGMIVRERTKLLLILAKPQADGMRRTEEIAAAYKRAFGQEYVLRVITAACVSF